MEDKTGDPSQILGDLIYTGRSHPYTHPQNLFLIGSLFGLEPPDFRTARVLELGCATGGNILPLALDYPEAHFTGYDIAANHIAEANRHKKGLGLKNIVFETKDLADIGSGDGMFDYIIVHGLLSWVPGPVRQHIFRICHENLSPRGLAYISYNAMPGWGALSAIRDMLLRHVKNTENPRERFAQARTLLDSLAAGAEAAQNTRYRMELDTVRRAFAEEDPSYALYEYTGPVNKAFFFRDISVMAQANRLQYVGEAIFTDMIADNPTPEAAALLTQEKNFDAQMQALDFVVNRQFHRSIFTHSGLPVRRNIPPAILARHYITPLFMRDGDVFRGTRWKEGYFSAKDPLTAAFFSLLAEHAERPVRLDDVLVKLRQRSGNVAETELEKSMYERAFSLFLKGFILLSADPARHATKLSQCPLAYPLAKYQAGLPGCGWVTNCRHETVQIPDRLALFILHLLDGTKTKDDLVDIVTNKFGNELAAKGDPREMLEKETDIILDRMISCRLLVA